MASLANIRQGQKTSVTKKIEFYDNGVVRLNFDRLPASKIPSGFAFGLVVRDPRKVLPPKRGCADVPAKGYFSHFKVVFTRAILQCVLLLLFENVSSCSNTTITF
jgi:hypothetical protein